MTPHTNPWQIRDTREIYDNNWIRVTEYDVINPSGGNGIYGKVHFKNRALGILVLDDELNIYLVGQYRFVLDQYSWEIPEGGGPLDENPLDAAKRELKEETGLTADHWEKLLDFHLSNSISDEFGHVYLARGLHQGEARPEETEDITVKKVPLEQAYQMVINGEITDSMSVAAIFRVKLLVQERH
jgi:8-oxo-dGTP pyrophosphatase MutT (NUDIX family)